MEMIQWEYRQSVYPIESGYQLALAKAGMEGWELCAVTVAKNDMVLWFKRPFKTLPEGTSSKEPEYREGGPRNSPG